MKESLPKSDTERNVTLPEASKAAERILPVVVFFLALLFFTLTLCPTAYLQESAVHIARHAGLDPFVNVGNMLWGVVLKTALVFPVGTIAVKANFMSAVFGAGCVALLFFVVTRFRHDHSNEEGLYNYPSRTIGLFSGLAAALFLAVSPPFWFVATRAHPFPFQACWLLGAVALLVQYRSKGRPRLLYLSCLVYGIGISEYAAMIAIFPLFGLFLLFALMKQDKLTLAEMMRCGALVLLGSSVLLLAAWRYTRTEAFAARELDGYFAALLLVAKDYYVTLARSVPRVGWLMIALLCVAPWFPVVGVPKLDDHATLTAAKFGSYALRFVATVIAVLILFNTHLAPFHLLELKSLVVTPYLFVASWFGYLAGYWLILLGTPHRFGLRVPLMKRMGAAACALTLLALTVGAGIYNHRFTDPRHGAAAAHLAKGILDDLGERKWILDDGILDPLLRIEAADRGIDVNILNARNSVLKPYLAYISSLFDDPVLQSMAEAGIVPLFQQWAARDPELHRKLLLTTNPDFWLRIGLGVNTARFSYGGVPASKGVHTPVAPLEEQVAFWRELDALLDPSAGAPEPLASINRFLRRRASKLVNNSGYFLQSDGRAVEALESYRLAYEIYAENLSALVNLVNLSAELHSPDADEWQTTFDHVLENLEQRPEIWAISYAYGYIHDPVAMAQRGMTWAMSGEPEVAVKVMEQAAASGAGGRLFELALAHAYSAAGDVDKSAKVYQEQLKKDNTDVTALFGLGRVMVGKRELDSARNCFARALDAGAPAPAVLTELAGIALLEGDLQEAESLLTSVIAEEPNHERGLCLLIMLIVDGHSEEEMDVLLERLKAIHEPGTETLVTLAYLAEEDRDYDSARLYFKSLGLLPGQRALALRKLILLDVKAGRRDNLEKYATELLVWDAHDRVANFMLGNIHLNRGEFPKAEGNFRVSIETQPTTGAYRGLAWLLIQREEYEEALENSQKALDINKTYGPAWGIRGLALMNLGRLDEAKASLFEAIQLAPKRPAFVVDLATLFENRGEINEALDLLNQLKSRDDLSGDLQIKIFDMQKRLQAAL